MGDVIAVFFRGALGVVAVTLLVGLTWIVYLNRDALASAVAPASELVNRLRGVTTSAEPPATPVAPPAPVAAPSSAAPEAAPAPDENPSGEQDREAPPAPGTTSEGASS